MALITSVIESFRNKILMNSKIDEEIVKNLFILATNI